MRVVTTREAESGNTGCYHIVDEENDQSLCGAVKEDQFFGGDAHEVFPRDVAEKRDLRPCEKCLSLLERADTAGRS
ncbi:MULTISPECIES: hypothetical protein [Halostella]|uniref:hypothetical protein n=1 Tax=Halostella TaxID=1843185 RepID=UPI0010813473|nr:MULTISPECIES: hypothetical protein [Halostella]